MTTDVRPAASPMPTSAPSTAMYSLLLEQLRREENPMTSIDGQEIAIAFTFDAAHSWIPFNPLMAELVSEHDRELLTGLANGGRLPRPTVLGPALASLSEMGEVEDQQSWATMTRVAAGLIRGHCGERSFQTYVELVEDVLSTLQPAHDYLDETILEFQSVDGGGATVPGSVDWSRINLEFFMQETCDVVNSIEFHYPGHGHSATLSFVCEESSDRFMLTAPANAEAADLLDHYYECHDPLRPRPMTHELNAMSPSDAGDLLCDLELDTRGRCEPSTCVLCGAR